ncbi:MAG: Crp/Fnr family transcriptional regulator [Bacteroidaceae bacterium]|nr:Crp/Fnr family transcriptional regulator [Bacteroidaceae bacterium]MBQ6801112.1 Crp/Fnr family transcriptional regulator [Bacteroidaceae bacterium]
MEKRYEIAKQFTEKYRHLSLEDTRLLSLVMEPLKLAKGEVFIKEGEVADYIHYVEKGLVRQFYFKNKRDLTEHISYEGNVVICIESYLRQEPTRLMAEALEPSLIWRIKKEDFNRITEQSRDIELFYRKIFEYSLLVSQEKADDMRFETAHDRYRLLMERHPEIVKRAPLIHIASFLQMTPETLSRVRSGVL